MKTIDIIPDQDFPLSWANLEYFPESEGDKVEISLTENSGLVEGLILMFYTLFGDVKNNIKVYNKYWWDYCLDTWDPNKDEYNYELDGKSDETKDYLILLKESAIEYGYSGICICNNWNKFLSIILTCIETHQAPYSPIFYNEEKDFFFYFHHTGSLGFYYKVKNEAVLKILRIAKEEYDLR